MYFIQYGRGMMEYRAAVGDGLSWYNGVIVRERPDVHQPHDKGFKSLLSSKKVFLELLRGFVAQPWVNTIRETDLTKIDKSFVSADFRGLESDLVYQISFDPGERTRNREICFFVLLELQSVVDHFMLFRLLSYIYELLRDAVKNAGDAAARSDFLYPVVIPIVLFNGKEPWSVPLQFKEKSSRVPSFNDSLNFKYILIDVHRIQEQQLLEQMNLISSVFVLDRVSDEEAMLGKLRRLKDILKGLPSAEWNLFWNWAQYIMTRSLTATDRAVVSRIVRESKPEEADSVISNLEETLRRSYERKHSEGKQEGILLGKLEGKLEGMLEGKQEVARRLLAMGMPVAQVVQVTELPEEEIRKLQLH